MQTTFVDERDHKTGFQVFGEVGLHRPIFDLDAVYLDATRLGQHTSNMFMAGIMLEFDFKHLDKKFRTRNRSEHDKDENPSPELTTGGIVINNSVFEAVGERLVSGLEESCLVL